MNTLGTKALQLHAAPWFIFIALPLFCVPNNPPATVAVRSLIVLILGGIVMAFPALRQYAKKEYAMLSPKGRLLFCALCLCMLISSVLAADRGAQSLFGALPSYMGLLHWYVIALLTLFYARSLRALLMTNLTAAILTAICLVSVFIDAPFLLGGNRLSGLLMQPTTMSFYGVLAVLIACWRSLQGVGLRWLNYLLGASGALVVLFAQSRIGLAGLFFVLALAVFQAKRLRTLAAVALAAGACAFAMVAFPSVFMRYSYEDVKVGVEYRAHVYQMAAQEIFQKRLIVGIGPTLLPEYLNDPQRVPEDIAATLHSGIKFASSHDLLLDVGLRFGAMALILSLIFLVAWIWRQPNLASLNTQWLLLLWLFTLVYSLVDVATIEVSPYLFMVTASLYYLSREKNDRL